MTFFDLPSVRAIVPFSTSSTVVLTLSVFFSSKGGLCHVLGLRNVCGSNAEFFKLSSLERHVVLDPFNRVAEAKALKLLELFKG